MIYLYLRIEDIKLLVISTREDGFGELKPFCENCDYILKNNWSYDPKVKGVYSGTSNGWEFGYVQFRKTKQNPPKMVPPKSQKMK